MIQGGRCYCGHVTISLNGVAEVSAYCHCVDCRRWTGAANPVFVAFDPAHVTLTSEVAEKSFAEGVFRRNCPECGTPLTARFDYLPNQTYIPVGVLDDPDAYPPSVHCYASRKIAWVQIHDDGLEKMETSSRSLLAKQDPA